MSSESEDLEVGWKDRAKARRVLASEQISDSKYV